MVTFKGNPLTVIGPQLKIGDALPEFTITSVDMKNVSSQDFRGKALLISAVPSIDTSVCSLQSKHFDDETAKYPNVQFITISLDLPFAQGRFAKEENCRTMPLYSDYKERSFAKSFGLLINELKLLARSIHIFDRNGKLVYQEIVPEMTDEPSYDKALQVLERV
jgi:thiol peroxidase